jgi:hypothetical protein
MTINPSIAHKTKEVQELIKTSPFQVYDKALPKILSRVERKLADLFIKKGCLHQISKVPRQWFADRAGCHKRTVSRALSLFRSMDLIDAYYSFYEVITFKLGLYFKQPGSISKMAPLFPSLKVVTPVLTSLSFLVSLNMSHYKVISNPVIYLKANFFVSNTSKETLRSSKEQFSDPPPPKSVPFLPQGAKHNESLLKQAIAKKERNEMTVSLDEATYKLNSYVKMQQQATHQAVIDLCNREIPKWRAIIYKLSNNGE